MSDSYGTLPDTPDPYDTTSQTSTDTDFSYIDRSQLPHPLPIVGPLFGYTKTYLTKLAASRLRYHTEAVGRSLSTKEMEAVIFHAHKSATISSIGVPIAFSIGMYRAYATRENYRVPVWGDLKSTEGWWDGQKLRIMGQTVAEGSSARSLMHSLRYSAYGSMALFFGGLVVNSYATTVAAVGELRDPRLKDFEQAIRSRSKAQMGDLEAMRTQRKDPTGQGNTTVSDLWKRHRKDIGGLDDASPSAGADGYGGEVERLGGSNTGIMTDSQMRSEERRMQASPNDSPTENRASTFRLDKVEKQPKNFDDTFDDASPTAPGDVDDGQGNAWERIRRQAQNPSSGKQRGQRRNQIKNEQQGGSAAGDSFTFSSDDEQRQLAKDEAQSEFDARVERERQGGNFNENRAKRW
ncbi:MAG: hypothetical protein Q9178_002349 [Gyalolechia marmorata]